MAESSVARCCITWLKTAGKTVVLVERTELTSGSSWHAAGELLTITRPNTAAEIHRYTFQIYSELEKESDQPCGFHYTGGINICRTQDEIDSNAMMQSACRRLGIESHFISLDEARDKVPFLDTSHMVGALWEEEGAKTATQRANEIWKKLLHEYKSRPSIPPSRKS